MPATQSIDAEALWNEADAPIDAEALWDEPTTQIEASPASDAGIPVASEPSPALVEPDTLSDDFTGLLANARVAGKGLMQASDVLLNQSVLAGVGRAKGALTAAQALGESPMRYIVDNAGQTAEERAQATVKTFGPTADTAAQRIVGRGQEMAALQKQLSPEMRAWNEARGWDAAKVFARNPVEVIGNLAATGAVSSIPAIALGAAGTLVGGPAGGAAGVGAGSFAVEFGNKIVEELRNEGVDLSKPDEIQKAFADDAMMDRIRSKAVRRGVPVAAFDAVSAGVAGRILGPVIGSGIRNVAGAVAKETGVQMLSGAAGESAGAIVAGDETSPKAMFEEAVGELGGGAREVAQNIYSERTASAALLDAASRVGPLTTDAVLQKLAEDQQREVPPVVIAEETPTVPAPESTATPAPETTAEPSPTDAPTVEAPVVAEDGRNETQQTEPITEEASETKQKRFGQTNDGGFSEHPVVKIIQGDIGGIMSKSSALKKWGKEKFAQNSELWDDAPQINPLHASKIYKANGLTPDEALSHLIDAGILPPDASLSQMWAEIGKISQSSATIASQQRQQKLTEKELTKQNRSFEAEASKPDAGEAPISVSTLQVGDQVTVGTETLLVTAIDPETFDVTLEDGKKYGVQIVEDDRVIYGEHDPTPQSGETFEGSSGSLFSTSNEAAKSDIPTLRSGENQGDLLSKQREDLTLVGQKGVDTVAQAEEKARAERESAEAKIKQDREQQTMFGGGTSNLTATVEKNASDALMMNDGDPEQAAHWLEGYAAKSSKPEVAANFRAAAQYLRTPEGTQGAIAAGSGMLTPNTPSAPIVPVKPISEIIRDLARGTGLPIRFGRLTTNRFAGYFKKVENLIGAKTANDMPIVSHEVGHKLDDMFGLSKLPALRTELDNLGDPKRPGSRSSWTKSKTLKYKHGEGIAEFVRYWLTDPPTATKLAPLTERYFESVLDANQDFGDVMRQAREDILNWRNAPSEARLDSSISLGSNPNKTRYTASQLTRDVVDDLHMLRLAVDDAERLSGEKKSPSENPYMLARLLRGSYGMADTFIRSGVIDFKTKQVTLGTSLEDALKPVAGRIGEFRRWIVAKRATELIGQGKETGLVPADVRWVAQNYNGDPVFQEAFAKVKAWNDALLQYAVDSGYVTVESAAAMRAMNEDYVPFHRVFEIGAGEDPSQGTTGSTGRGLNVGKAASLRALTGSPRDIVDPLETMVKNAYTLITAAEKSAINGAIAELSSSPGMGQWVEKVAMPKEAVRFQVEKIRQQLEDAGADLDAVPDDLLVTFFQNSGRAPFGENIIKVTQRGETTFYRLKSDLFDAFHALDNDDSSRFIQILAAPAQWLRAGVTLTPDFALSNLMRDAFSSAVINRYGMLPFEGAIRGMSAMIRTPQLVAEWSAAGGAQSLEANFFDRKKLSAFVRQRVTQDLSPAERALIVIKSPLTALRMMTGALESVTRIGEYQKAYNQAVKGGMSTGEARRLAAFEARDRQDFAKGGAKTKPLRHAAAFWNAAVQANVKLAQAIKERPIRTMTQGLLFVTIPKLIEQALNWDDDDYWDRPQWERDLFFLIPIGKDENNRTSFLRIPTPFEVGLIFGTVPGRMMQWAKTNRSDAFKDLVKTVLRQTVPNPIPQSVQVVISDFMTGERGWDFFAMKPIVPEAIAELPPELQWTEQTSLTARTAGKYTGMSPLKVDHIIRNTTGGLGQQIVHNAIDRAISLGTGEERTAMNKQPGMRFFAVPAGISSEAVNKFYLLREELRKEKAGAAAQNKTFKRSTLLSDMESASTEMAELRREAKAAKTQEAKQRLYLQIADKAKRFTE